MSACSGVTVFVLALIRLRLHTVVFIWYSCTLMGGLIPPRVLQVFAVFSHSGLGHGLLWIPLRAFGGVLG